MDGTRRYLRRTQLDSQLKVVRETPRPYIPTRGWIRAIREALGLTHEVFGRRMGVSRQTAFQIESAETSESITLRRLRAAADSLECDLVVAFVPRSSLEEVVQLKARTVAYEQHQRMGHTMSLEAQGISQARIEEMVNRLAQEIIERHDQRIWEPTAI
jgi:predicted DNA-binding mobile mystery protein A